jgi:hypothetical protein
MSLARHSVRVMTNTQKADLSAASERALGVRALYEILEQRFNGKTWSMPELMLGYSNDVGYIGRLLLAEDGTWPVEGDATAELKHKLAESLWCTFVLADKLDIDITAAFGETMDKIQAGLESTIERTAPAE